MNLVLGFFVIIFVTSATASDNKTCNSSITPSCFAKAYKGYIKSIRKDSDQIYFVMNNDNEIPWFSSHPSTFEEKLESPSLSDVVSLNYPVHRKLSIVPNYNEDPGRFRNTDFLKAVYGDSKKEVEKNLIKVQWLPKTLSSKPVYLLFNQQNNAAKSLQMVITELDALPKNLRKYVTNDMTYHWRPIAGSNRLSPHSFGIAIDINNKYSNYWYWDSGSVGNEKEASSKSKIKYHNRIPKKIVDIFERHGFIWGGRWYHYDTMHFEYRPEFFVKN